MTRRCTLPTLAAVFGLLSVLGSAPAQALDWKTLWFSADQRAARQLDREQYDQVIEESPSATWTGLSHFRQDQFGEAAAAFAEDAAHLASDAGRRAAYNQATALVRAGDYATAIQRFDELLESNPAHADAAHNRAIAEELLALSQQPGADPSSDGDGENSESGSTDNNESGAEQSPDPSGGESSANEGAAPESGDRAQDPAGDSTGSQADGDSSSSDGNEASDGGADSEAESEADREAREAAAEAALAAERAQEGASAEPPSLDGEGVAGNSDVPIPMSEEDQATEQWLKRIPDDPAGLLRRKLQQSHRVEYPQVGNSDKPW